MTAATKTDFYKVDHRRQYPEGTELVFSNWTPRGSRVEGIDRVVFFGLQAALTKMAIDWDNTFFARPEDDAVAIYQDRLARAGFDIDDEHMRELHRFGVLPIEVWSLPEGTRTPIGVPMFVMWNTRPEFFWVTNYLETTLSANLWGPCTSATLAAEFRSILDSWCRITGGDPDFVDWQAHDFSYRGMYGDEAACMSGAGHLLSFKGTDTFPAIRWLEEYYQGTAGGGSVPATEHSVMCMGTADGEFETFKRLITEVYPTGVVSIVSDTWDLWKVLTDYMPRLKKEILARDGKVVIRPDSGDPFSIICGALEEHAHTPQRKGVWRLLYETFGGHVNDQGYIELNPKVGAIYGDSISLTRCDSICRQLAFDGFVPSMVFGVGSYTYQHVTRDTFGFALKATYGEVNGQPRPIFKDPVTDSGEKKSARGLLAVTREDGCLTLKQDVSWADVMNCEFVPVFRNGTRPKLFTLDEVRNTLAGER